MRLQHSRFLLGASLTAMASVLLIACNKTPEADAQAAAPAITVGTQLDDSIITSRVKSALLAEPTIKSMDLQVETRRGTVILSGFVDSQAQIDQALSLTHGVAGVTEVQNGVTLKGAARSVGNQVDDATVTGRVKTALLADPAIQSFDISVLTVRGEVQLSGFVNNQGQINLATEIARVSEGASSVKSELRIKE